MSQVLQVLQVLQDGSKEGAHNRETLGLLTLGG